MVISEVTARTEPMALDFKDTYKNYLAGVRGPSEIAEGRAAVGGRGARLGSA